MVDVFVRTLSASLPLLKHKQSDFYILLLVLRRTNFRQRHRCSHLPGSGTAPA